MANDFPHPDGDLLNEDTYEKKGYLKDNFRVFHLKDCEQKEYSFHYHDFAKILVLLSGDVHYTIEGRTYPLAPYDIVLVDAGQLHRPIVHSDSPYERIILYVSPDYLSSFKSNGYDLSLCFQKAREEHTNVLRISSVERSLLYDCCRRLSASLNDNDYAHDLQHSLLFLEFLIQLNRAVIHNRIQYLEMKSSNTKILSILDFIGTHLTEDLTPDSIAAAFYINKYYLMHLFKSETGYTLSSYITNKRLLLARELLEKGIPATQVCYDCGFKNYSTFSRAYKKCFQSTPRNLMRSR
ncbi:MAG: AraC family transcriptional regulator [Clostridiales bacterium]|nr:AraC family transcriptional regulator [Clostridiales bacterium]